MRLPFDPKVLARWSNYLISPLESREMKIRFLTSVQFLVVLIGCLLAICVQSHLDAEEKKTREQKVREDRQKVEAEGFWIYNDLPRAFEQAKATGKPILVVLRCIPCEECVKLDDDLVDKDPVIRPLLDQFVCVRVVSTNGLDLSLFQFDTDQSFAAFLLNADGTIYGRFGTRSHRNEWAGDVSLSGLSKALQGALALHRTYPKERDALAAKRGPTPRFPSPETYLTLKDKYTSKLAETGNIVQSCIHCHQIGDAQRDLYRAGDKPIPDDLLFPFPHPKSVGLVLDPEERAMVQSVDPGSIAAASGFLSRDEILRMNGQPLLSIADVQWVLQGVDNVGGDVAVLIRRDGRAMNVTLSLPSGWRAAGDISWRASTWGLRRMATGGLLLEALPENDRLAAGIQQGQMALLVKHVGQYGAHAAAKNAGFRKDDIVVSVDGRTDLFRESDLIRLGLQSFKPGESARVTVLREGKRIELNLPFQK